MVGDKYSDVQLAFNVGAKGILVLSGYGRGELELFGKDWPRQPDKIAETMKDAVDYVFETLGIDG